MQQIYHYLSLFPTSQTYIMNEQQLRNLCFQGIRDTKHWGYSSKRIGVKIQGSITDKIAFSGFGYKTSNGTFKIGMRMWLDQGDYVKYVPYDNNYSINQHFMELIHKFQYEYPNLW
jgi:hypothetical protein